MSGEAKPLDKKLARLRAGAKARVLDLFCGCGGISLGFKAAGFEIAAALDSDNEAAASHGMNFHPGDTRHGVPRDVTKLSPEDLCAELGLGPVGEAIDVIVGGPPCQAFARVGRSKLREIDAHPEAFKHDPRARLYLQYLRYVDAFQPLALLMENVPDVLNHAGQNIAEETCEVLRSKGYVAAYTLLNASHYGVPQMRDRMILLAYRRELGIVVTFPRPTHRMPLPSGYARTRQVALKSVPQLSLPGFVRSWVETPVGAPEKPAVTAREALGDLPVLTDHLRGLASRGARRFDRVMPYAQLQPTNGYVRLMRSWPGYENADGVRDHVIRYLPRDWKLFRRMNAGDQYPEARALAQTMFDEALEALLAEGQAPRPGTPAWEALEAEYLPPYDPGNTGSTMI